MNFFVLNIVDSTQLEAKRYLDKGQATPFLVASKQQTHGKGRYDRAWETPEGNLAVTLVFKDDLGIKGLKALPIQIPVTLCRVLARYVKDVVIKWPNDLLMNFKKIGGILIEQHEDHLLIGIGINLKHAPKIQRPLFPPTSILTETGKNIDFETILGDISQEIQQDLAVIKQQGLSQNLHQQWMECAHGLGQVAVVKKVNHSIKGKYLGINLDGYLTLEKEDGEIELISSADLFF